MNSGHTSLVEELCTSPFATGWPHGIVSEVVAISRYVMYPAGSIIFEQGAVNRNLFLICSGLVGLDMCVPARGTVRILTLSRGELLAWSAVIGDGRMTATATALEPVRAIAIDGSKLSEVCKQRPEIGCHVMTRLAESLAQRLTATRLQLLDLYAHTTPHVLRFGASDH